MNLYERVVHAAEQRKLKKDEASRKATQKRKKTYNKIYKTTHKEELTSYRREYKLRNPEPKYVKPPIYHEKRICESCAGKLELSRWFNCLTCQPTLGEDDGPTYYHTRESANFRISELPLLAGGAI